MTVRLYIVSVDERWDGRPGVVLNQHEEMWLVPVATAQLDPSALATELLWDLHLYSDDDLYVRLLPGEAPPPQTTRIQAEPTAALCQYPLAMARLCAGVSQTATIDWDTGHHHLTRDTHDTLRWDDGSTQHARPFHRTLHDTAAQLRALRVLFDAMIHHLTTGPPLDHNVEEQREGRDAMVTRRADLCRALAALENALNAHPGPSHARSLPRPR